MDLLCIKLPLVLSHSILYLLMPQAFKTGLYMLGPLCPLSVSAIITKVTC